MLAWHEPPGDDVVGMLALAGVADMMAWWLDQPGDVVEHMASSDAMSEDM